MTGLDLYFTHKLDGHLRKIQINDRNLKRIIADELGLDLTSYILDKVEQIEILP